MSYGIFHARPYTILRTIAGETPKRSAMAEVSFPPACAMRMASTSTSVNFIARFLLVEAKRLWAECTLFSTIVLHDKFVLRLFSLSPSKWFTVGRVGSGVKKAAATKRCTNSVNTLPSFPKLHRRYPFIWRLNLISLGMWPRAEMVQERIRPKELTSYRGKSMTDFQVSILKLQECYGNYIVPHSSWGG